MRPSACTQGIIADLHACTHNTPLPVAAFWGTLYLRRSLIKHTLPDILSCTGAVHHNGKVQRVSSEEAITGLYTSPPVSPAFCLSADAVKPSIFSTLFYMSPFSICTSTHTVPCQSILCVCLSFAVYLILYLSSFNCYMFCNCISLAYCCVKERVAVCSDWWFFRKDLWYVIAVKSTRRHRGTRGWSVGGGENINQLWAWDQSRLRLTTLESVESGAVVKWRPLSSIQLLGVKRHFSVIHEHSATSFL